VTTDRSASARMRHDQGRVLIVDDTRANILLLIELLKPDYELRFATEGQQGLVMANEDPQPDLILLDVLMPNMDGYEVCRRLKASERTRNIPVVFVTGADSEAEETRGIDLGAVDYITRPISGPILRARVRTHVNARRQGLVYEQLALVDGLTGLANRRRFDEALQAEWDRCHRERQPISLLFADVDHFKRYNDVHGHGAGDEVLRQVARQLMQVARRPGDLGARYGGEEFVLLMPNTSEEGAYEVAEVLRERVERLVCGPAPVSISVGCHTLLPTGGMRSRELVVAADEQLYRAKGEGRNRVCTTWRRPPQTD
jgi:diguanylate cyclase (GGDEF)-like protein